MVFNLFPGILDTPFIGSHDLVECGQVRRIGGQEAAAALAATCLGGMGHEGMGAEGVPEGPPLEDEPPDRAGDGAC
jgi:hypothetical protein